MVAALKALLLVRLLFIAIAFYFATTDSPSICFIFFAVAYAITWVADRYACAKCKTRVLPAFRREKSIPYFKRNLTYPSLCPKCGAELAVSGLERG